MFIAPFSRRTIEQSLRAGGALVLAAREAGAATFAASLVEGPAVLLGRHQRAARVVDLAEAARLGIPVFRRRTAGTAAFASGRTLVFTLALPGVTTLFPDASYRTLLNRNVRPFLKGLTAAGALSHYFGREWVSSQRRPVLLLGFDVEPDGAVLIEAVAGFDHPFSLPPSLASEDERSLDRFTGGSPAALAELLPEGKTPESVAQCVADAIAARAPTAMTEAPISSLLPPRRTSPMRDHRPTTFPCSIPSRPAPRCSPPCGSRLDGWSAPPSPELPPSGSAATSSPRAGRSTASPPPPPASRITG